MKSITIAFALLTITLLGANPLLAKPNLHAGILVVDPGDPDAYVEIQDAVDAASPGDTIKVHAGTYGPVVISTDDLTIKAADDDSSPVVDATGFEVGVLIDANGVTVKGLTARNATLNGEDFAYGFEVIGDNNTLINNTATDSANGIGIFGSAGNSLKGNLAEGNDYGFTIAFASNITLKGNTAHGNGIGFAVIFGDAVTLKENTASGNETIGIWVVVSSFVTLKENSSYENRDGYQIIANVGTSAKENEAFANDRHGFIIAFGENGSSFKENRADGNGEYGFFILQYLLDDEFKENECSGNGLGGSNVPGICD